MNRIHDLRAFAAFALAISFSATPLLAGYVEGFTEPNRDIEVSIPGEPGLITEIRVKEGQKVAEGEVLVVLDTKVLEASLAVAKRRAAQVGRIKAAQAEVALRRSRADKLRQMSQRGNASPIEFKRAVTDYDVAKANLILAEEEQDINRLEVARIEAQIDKSRLRSPCDGIIVEVFKEAGESTQISDSRLLQIVQLSVLRVDFPVSIAEASKYKAGDRIDVSLPEISKEAIAVVEVVSPVLDAESGTVKISCVIDNAQGKFRSGMSCQLPVEGEGSSGDDFNVDFDSLDADDIIDGQN